MFSSNTSQVSNDAVFVEDVFSNFLYTGNSSTQTINNGIDLSGKGGLVWRQGRSAATGGMLIDTARGIGSYLISYSTDAAQTGSNWIDSFNSNGFTMNSSSFNGGATYASWTFRKQKKFFDVVTYTGTGSATTIAHNLGSVPGCIIVKQTSASGNYWTVYHTSLGNTQRIFLNTNDPSETASSWNNTTPTSTVFSVGTSAAVNGSGSTYVAYLFAHNAGGFGLTGTDNVISCGSYTGTGATGNNVTLGYEPQWLMIKAAERAQDWFMFDTMRGMTTTGGTEEYLLANTADAAGSGAFGINPTATGFGVNTAGTSFNASGEKYIYIAIRRGPMKVPTDATKVYQANTYTGNATANTTVAGNFGFPVDLLSLSNRSANATNWSTYGHYMIDRLRGQDKTSGTANTSAESAGWQTYNAFDVQNSIGWGLYGADSNTGYMNNSGSTFIARGFQRAPSFFDEVCYTGTGSARTVTHNLGVAPELIIVKGRNTSYGWPVYVAPVGNTSAMQLQGVSTPVVSDYWNNTTPTASVFSLGTAVNANESTKTYVAYLFATCAGVSKVGSYTGTGTTKQIDCGFTAGSRFVMIKRTDDDAGWYVWDSARGIVSGNDPYLLLNSTAAEVTNTDYVDTYSAGFELSSTAPAAINASGGTFIFLAIA